MSRFGIDPEDYPDAGDLAREHAEFMAEMERDRRRLVAEIAACTETGPHAHSVYRYGGGHQRGPTATGPPAIA